jgi:hypothetical protein
MSCNHKFFGHHEHLKGDFGLIPSWPFKTLIIGTFNPENRFHPDNSAQYYYGRSRNYLWKVLPKFAGEDSIPHQDVKRQINFLKNYEIGLTDLLISVVDADVNNSLHKDRIKTVLDNQIESFSNFKWNTEYILETLKNNKVGGVYFTKLGLPNMKNIGAHTFEFQMRIIEKYCKKNNISHNRLFTPSANGLGKGSPKENHLITRWFKENGGNRFHFLSKDFNLDKFKYS